MILKEAISQISAEVQAASVQDAEVGREDAESAAFARQPSPLPGARDARTGRQDHQGMRQGA